jgi:hypothetical protein
LNALRANPTAMVIALLFGDLTKTTQEEGDGGEMITKTIINYEKALELAENRSNLSIWTFDEAVIGGLRAKWKPMKSDYDAEENIGNAVRPIKDENQNIVGYNFHLGDFAVLGDFLQELIGKEQFKIEQDGV